MMSFLPFNLKRTFLGLTVFWLLVAVWASPSPFFPINRIFTIKAGANVAAVADSLAGGKFIGSKWFFRLALRLQSGAGVVVAGDYFLDRPINVFRVAGRLTRGDYGFEPVRVTFPEGATVRAMEEILVQAAPNFDRQNFVALAEEFEGYLFPDTYFFRATVRPEEVISRLRAAFAEKIRPLIPVISSSGRTLEQIIIMASLLEKEASETATRQAIAGILWKRLDHGMPLQVDAVFPYILEKNTFELNQTDLATSSPYNTYRYRGLPVGPIANPGADAIFAALHPTDSPYWYYLSDRSGETHYAVDFDEHRANKTRYLSDS